MKKLTQTSLTLFLMSIIILFYAGCQNAGMDLSQHDTGIHSRAAIANHFERHIPIERHVPTLNDNFVNNRVIVTLRQEYSDVNREIDMQVFRTANIMTARCIAEYELSHQDIRSLDRIIIESVRDLMYITNPDVIIDRTNWTQILSIELRENCKKNVLRVIKELEQLDKVLAAEPDFLWEAVDLTAPNDPDPFFYRQWGLNGPFGIQAESAWAITTGATNPRIRVGIFETGIADHPDLRVIPGNMESGPVATGAQDHGTHVGGIIGAITGNGTGIAGVAQVELALLDRGNAYFYKGDPYFGSNSTFVNSLQWAINNQIRIVNASFRFIIPGSRIYGGGGIWVAEPAPWSYAHRNAIRNFGDNGGLLVAGAGNDGNRQFQLGNTDVNPIFPAGYGDVRHFPDITNVISVGAIYHNGMRSAFSNFGQHSVHIFAPGSRIYSTFPGARYRVICERLIGILHVAPGYARTSGTSMAAPHVSGVAALMLSVNPNLTPAQIRQIILANVDPMPNCPVRGRLSVSGGRLNAYRAVRAAQPHHNVTFCINGGTGTPPTQLRVPHNTVITLPDGTGFSKPGHTLASWSTSPDGWGGHFFPGECFTVTEGIALYAHWIWDNTFEIPIFLFGYIRIGYIVGEVGRQVDILDLETPIFPGCHHVFEPGWTTLQEILSFGHVPPGLSAYLMLNNRSKTIFCTMGFVGILMHYWQLVYWAHFDIIIQSNHITVVGEAFPGCFWDGSVYTTGIRGSSNPAFKAFRDSLSVEEALQQFKRNAERQR